MWRLAVSDLSNKTVFNGQKILFMGTIKAQVTSVYVEGRKVQSAFFSTNTKPVFRSESARYVLFIQMSKEMWDFDSEGSGEIMFNKVVNGFLPALFKKWVALRAKHLVSIILFTRVEYDTGLTSELAASAHDNAYHTGVQTDGSKKPYKDFYRVVVSEMASGSWTTILYQLKREFKFFRKDISMHRIDTASGLNYSSPEGNMRGAPGTRIEAEPSLAMYGNVLEAINLASSQFSSDYIDRDLMRTGISIVVITPCPGLFEVDYETLRMTTETLIGNGIGIDLVCLPKMPLHSVPIFRYRNPQYATFQESLHLKSFRSEESTPRQNAPIFSSSFSSLNNSLSPTKASLPDRSLRNGSVQAQNPSEWNYAIPHWIDVSFWTGASQDINLMNPSRRLGPMRYKRLRNESSSDFAVRCKMYEMEMASVMENVVTEISVTPLQHDSLFPQMMTGLREGTSKNIDESGEYSFLRREKPYASLNEVISGPLRSLVDRNSSHNEKEFYRTLAAFDTAISEVSEGYPRARQRNDGKNYLKAESEGASRSRLAEDQKLFSSSFNDDSETPKGMSTIVAAGAGPSNARVRDEVSNLRKDSTTSTMTGKSQVSPHKVPKLGRQISLGKHGFGIAAPKAAIAELQTEHVSAAKPRTVLVEASEAKKVNSGARANQWTSTTSERPVSSQSEKLKSKPDNPSNLEKTVNEAAKNDKNPTTSSRPMTIKSALQNLDATNQFKSRSVLGSVYEGVDPHSDTDESHTLQSLMKSEDNQKLYTSKLRAGSIPEFPITLSPTTALSPWLRILNPSNPTSNAVAGASQYSRWQHVFPKPLLTKTMKWKSLCCPASVPITTEYFPTKHQLETEYQQKPYNISQNVEDEHELNEIPRAREEFLRELIGLRLSQGFQIVVGPAVAEAFGQKSIKITNVFNSDRIAEDGASIFMSMGNIIHQLSCVNGTEIEVNMLVRKPTASTPSILGSPGSTVYNPAIRTTLADNYESRQIILGKPKEEYNWNYVDTFIAGFDDEMSENLRFWRARFVLIPVERPTPSQWRQGEDNEEEIRLEGIKKLTQMWQRHRVITASERRFQSLASRKMKHPNPLDIVYRTDDPSVVVTAELETLPLVEPGDGAPRRGQLFEPERFRKSKLDIAALAEAIQAPVERGGVRMQNRRWHFRLHHNCFIGSDMTTWLIENFEDIETRGEAVELGDMLMAKDRDKEGFKENIKEKDKDMGIFVHVEKRHPFRDGQYFYQVMGEFAKQRPESRSGWFGSKRRDTSIPPTPASETPKDSPKPPERSWSGSTNDDRSSDSGTSTPVTTGGLGKRPRVALSKVMKYDVDHRKRSYRPERINLHYDRLHNPDNCYHIRIDWMSVTAKLIEDAVESWASTAGRYGLRLVEAPIGEASSIISVNPFRSPYIIELATKPPDRRPPTYFDINSFAPQGQSIGPHYYQKAIMKRFNFVLDIEAARNFPSNIDVTYSWGRPHFKHTQYIHRSGVLFAQITDEGNFLLLANRLYNNRTAAARESDRYVRMDHADRADGTRIGPAGHLPTEKPTPMSSPLFKPTVTGIQSPVLKATSDVLGPSLAYSKLAAITTPENIKNDLEAFCLDGAALDNFYTEVYEKALPLSATPPSSQVRSPLVAPLADVPVLGLPPSIFARDTSPTPMRLSGVSGIGSPMLPSGRRQSVQLSALSLLQGGNAEGRAEATTATPRGGSSGGDKES
jgi:DEP domain-containing protein 5